MKLLSNLCGGSNMFFHTCVGSNMLFQTTFDTNCCLLVIAYLVISGASAPVSTYNLAPLEVSDYAFPSCTS
jgi:hypothetical protein